MSIVFYFDFIVYSKFINLYLSFYYSESLWFNLYKIEYDRITIIDRQFHLCISTIKSKFSVCSEYGDVSPNQFRLEKGCFNEECMESTQSN